MHANLLATHRPVKLKPESDMSCHITLTSVISTLFYTSGVLEHKW